MKRFVGNAEHVVETLIGNIEKFVILEVWKGHCLGIAWYLLL
jgi:hypothetical protein